MNSHGMELNKNTLFSLLIVNFLEILLDGQSKDTLEIKVHIIAQSVLTLIMEEIFQMPITKHVFLLE
jgi:hypothetical protein